MYAALDMQKTSDDAVKKHDEKSKQSHRSVRNETGIPTYMKDSYEAISGFSFDDVRVHYNSDKPAQFQALAYTQGDQIYIGAGHEQHLRHELGHVIQQKMGIVRPTGYIGGVPVNEDVSLETASDNISHIVQKKRRMVSGSVSGVVQMRRARPSDLNAYVRNVLRLNIIITKKLALKLCNIINSTTKWRKLLHRHDLPSFRPLDPFLLFLQDKRRSFVRSTRIPNIDAYMDVLGDMLESISEITLDASGMHTRNLSEKIPQYPTIAFYQLFKALSSNQKVSLYTQIAKLRECCNKDGIKSIIEGSLANVKRMSLYTIGQDLAGSDHANSDSVNFIKAKFIDRLTLMTDYVVSVSNRLDQHGIAIKNNYIIKSTGSDPHEKGAHALFLEPLPNSGMQPRVYKPHSLALEKAFMGTISGNNLNEQSSIIEYANKLMMPGDRHLPTMDINATNSTQETIQPYGDYDNPLLDEDSVSQSFRQLGMLQAIAATVGLTDLHAENIMYTRMGENDACPIIVDGECGGNNSSTSITGGSSGVSQVDELDLTNPSALYYLPRFRPEQYIRSDNDLSFQDGKERMEAYLIKNLRCAKLKGSTSGKSFVEHFAYKMSTVDSFRFVLIPTNALAEYLEKYLFNQTAVEDIAQNAFDIASDSIVRQIWFYSTRYMDKVIEERPFKYYYIATLRASTLPSFTLVVNGKNAGNVLLDGNYIGYVKSTNKNKTAMIYNELFKKMANDKIQLYENTRIITLISEIDVIKPISKLEDHREHSERIARNILNILSSNTDANNTDLRKRINENLWKDISMSIGHHSLYIQGVESAKIDSEAVTKAIMALPYLESLIEQFAV